MLRKKVNLLDVWIDDISMKDAIFLAYKSLHGGERRCFFTPNLEMISRAMAEEKEKDLLNSASVALPDGYGLKIVARIMGKEIKNTVAGIDFGEKLLGVAEKEGANIFLLGGRRGVCEEASKKLLKKHPRLKICGMFHGYFKKEHEGAVCRMIEKSGADILIVCQGFPKQEYFARFVMNKAKNIKVIACLGGSIDVWAGNVNRAPECIRDMHLEWLWRTACEPSRCGRLIKSLGAFTGAFEYGFKKIISCGMKQEKRAYNQTDICSKRGNL